MNKKNILLGGVITLVSAFTIAATGWNFKATAEMPSTYVNKTEYAVDEKRNEQSHLRIEKKLDEIKDLILKLHIKKGD